MSLRSGHSSLTAGKLQNRPATLKRDASLTSKKLKIALSPVSAGGVKPEITIDYQQSVVSSEGSQRTGIPTEHAERQNSITLPPCPLDQRHLSILKIDDPMICQSVPGDQTYMSVFKEVLFPKQHEDKAHVEKTPADSLSVSTSRQLTDTFHRPSIETRPSAGGKIHTNIDDFYVGCKKPENEVNFMGGLGPCVGNKRSNKCPQRATAIQKIFRMRNSNYPLLSLTENPRKAQCPVRKRSRVISNLEKIVENVELADNVNTPTASASASSTVECIEFDYENPMNLDLQGQDYRQTYEKDEQEIENAREYYQQLLHMKRRVVKAEIANLSEERQRKKKYAIPEFFDINVGFNEAPVEKQGSQSSMSAAEGGEAQFPKYHTPPHEEIPLEEESVTYAQLFRTTGKKENQQVIEQELARRVDRYYQLWVRGKAKEKEAAEKQVEDEKHKEETLVMDLGEQYFEDLLKDKYQECLELYKNLPAMHEKRRYPHTLRETKQLKHKMAKSRKIIRDKAIIKTDVLASKGIHKDFPEKYLDVPEIAEDEKNEPSLSEQSSDDEDDMYVGKINESTYQIRGFHYKLGSEPRGLFGRIEKTKLADPISLGPDITPAFFQYNPSSLKRTYIPNDPNINLFPPKCQNVHAVKVAPIKDYLSKPLQSSDAQRKEVRLKIKKPKYIKVKKFTLTGYMYGARKQRKPTGSTRRMLGERNVMFEKFFKQVADYSDTKNLERREKRYKRLRYLGIPCKQNQTNYIKASYETSETESSEWIPDNDQLLHDTSSLVARASKDNHGRSQYDKVKHQETIGNMPAPKFREPTLRNHPRRPRRGTSTPIQLDTFSADSVSIISKLDQRTGQDMKLSPRYPYNVPRLTSLPADAIRRANVDTKKVEYANLFDARHHYDHADPADHKSIRVRYKNKWPEIETAEKLAVAKVSKQKRPFERAYPRGKDFKERDFSVPQVVYEEEIKVLRAKSEAADARKKPLDKEMTFTQPNERSYKTRKNYQDNLPGKSEYIAAVRKMAAELRREVENIKEHCNVLAINEKEYAETILKEIASIDSCVTSLESSTCTNFTNDSGSYIMIEDKKIPCDYITKSFVPFEEIDRARVKAARADAIDHYKAPYFTVPYSGQKQDQLNLAKPTDRFFTYNQRSRVGRRKRLEVLTPDFRTELLGTGDFKAPSRLATEWDENYQHEIRNRPPVAPFKRKTTMIMLRDGLRKKFETLYMHGQIAEQQIVQQKEIEYANEVFNLQAMCHDLFQKVQENHYRISMLTIEKIKPFYQRSDLLKKNYHELEKVMIKLNMRIVFIEDDWIRRTILQNFHYLIMEQNWRLQHDWIHLQEDGTLEDFRTSINNRRTTNIRKRDRDDAWAIKEYYESTYLPNKRPIQIVFPDAETFNEGVHKLKARTFVCLLEMHFSMWVLANLQREYNQFTQDSQRLIKQTTKFVKDRGANRYFMQDRANNLEEMTRNLFDNSLHDSVGSPRTRTIEPLCDMLYVQLIPECIRNDIKEDCSTVDKVEMIFAACIDVLGKLDRIPTKEREIVERVYRKNIEHSRLQSQQACLIEKRIQAALEEVKRNMAPPYKKPLHTGKLSRIVFKKKEIIKEESVHELSEKNKLFIQAFTESDGEENQLAGGDPDIINSFQDNCIPFYFDYFLRMHDYEPNYDFKTQIELNEGQEENRFLYKDVLDGLRKNLEIWQMMKKKKMEMDIQKTLYLYQDNDASS